MPKKLKGLVVHEVSGVDAAANRRVFLVRKGATKTEAGQAFPASAYAYTPDRAEPSTWKLRLTETPGGQPTAAQVGRAIAALGKGFRGNRVEIPARDLAAVKAKVLAAWRSVHDSGDPVPAVLKGASMPTPTQNAVNAFVKAFTGLMSPAAPATTEEDPGLEAVCCSMTDAIDGLLNASNQVAKRAATVTLFDVFKDALGSREFLEAAGVAKAGKKISGARMKQLQTMKEMLDKMIDEAAEKDSTDPGGDGGVEMSARKDDTGRVDAAAKKPKGEADGDEDDDPEDEPDGDEPDGEQQPKGKKPAKKGDTMAKNDELTALKKRMDEQDTALKKAQDDLAKERELREDAEYLQKAKDIGPVPGSTFEETAKVLKSMAAAGAPQLAAYEKQLRASAELAKQSSLLKEVGAGGSGGGATDAAAVVIAKAQEIVKAEKIGFGDALERVAQAEPALYADYVRKQRQPVA